MRTALTLLFALSTSAFAGEDGGFDQSHAAFDAFLGSAVSNAGVDYEDLASRRKTLDGYLAEVETTDISGFGPKAQLAFWINAYNALTLRLILDEKPSKSIMDIDGGQVWKTRKYTVAGQTLSLDEIEHTRIRPLGDGRIHSAVNCASKGCPPLAPHPFTADKLESQLDAGARRWAQTNAYVIEGDQLKLSVLFDWFADDFKAEGVPDIAGADAKQDAAIHFLAPFAGQDASKLQSGKYTVSWNEYDWALNNR